MIGFWQVSKFLTCRWALFLAILLVGLLVHSALADESEPVEEPMPAEETAEPVEILPTEIVPEVVLPEPTPMPTEIVPEVVPPEPTALPVTSIDLITSATRLPANAMLSAIITGENLSGFNHFALTCQVDPAILRGILSVPGDLLPVDQVVVSDSGFQADGQWQFTAAYLNSALPAAGVLWSLNYEVIGTGFTSLLCWIQAVDASAQLLPVTIPAAGLTIEGYEISAPPIGVETVSTLVPIESVVVEPALEAAAEMPLVATSHLSGYVESLFPIMEITVIMRGAALDAATPVDSDGAFAFDLPPGDYQLTVKAPYHLPYTLNIVISELPLMLPAIKLTGGDVDSNAVIDAADTDLIIRNYGLTVPPAPPAADLNGDGIVNLFDLTLVSAKINQIG